MYGIIDFEEKLKNISDEELAPHLSPELARIPWPQERDEFLPKPFRNQKFVYKGDYLSDRLITQQERAQDYLEKLQNKFRIVSNISSTVISKLEDRFDDRDLFPTIGLASICGLIGWRSSGKQAFVPVRLAYAITGITLSSLLTHQKLRDSLWKSASNHIPSDLSVFVSKIDTSIGEFGARIWDKLDVTIAQVKNKVKKI